MSWLAAALEETAGYPSPEPLSTFERSIEPQWIEEALAATGTASMRRRRLPAEQVVWVVLGMALTRDRPIKEVVSKLDLALPGPKLEVASSSVSQARSRLGPAPLHWLFDRCSTQWALQSAATHKWQGLSVFALDGTTLRVADSDANRAHFGLASGGDRAASGYPMLRMVALAAARSHLIYAAAFGPYSDGEHTYAQALWERIPTDSVTLVDRGFFAARIFLGVERGENRHWLIRTKVNTKWRILKRLGRDDLVVELDVSPAARQADPTLPRTFTARAVGYTSPRRERAWLLTSLSDSHLYPAKDIIALYRERWELELAYDELKTHLLDRRETIRSRSVAGVEQELWGILLTYNLVRLEMERIAAEANVPPARISFLTAMRLIRDEWSWCAVAQPGTIPQKLRRLREELLRFILPARRSKRIYPRAVKIKMSHYAKKRPDSARGGPK
jgi:Insertion element 4 transposase N-terminal/Transposase DDE domain